MNNKINTMNIIIYTCIGIIFCLLIYIYFNRHNIFTSISFIDTEITLKVGEEKKLNLKTKNISNDEIIWDSSDSSVVSVTSGNIKGLKKGNVTITASKYDKKATINVIVLDILPEKISFKDKDITIMVGDNRKLDYELKPANVTDKKVIWEISDNSIIKNNNGVITALVVGTALVKIKTVNGYEDTCTIHVINRDIPLEKIKIVKPTETLYVNETIRINTIIIPSNATNKTLKWSSSNNEIATVENGVVKALKKGTVTIKVYDSEEKIYDQIDLEVLKPIINVLPNEITIIGDSRMVGLCGYKWYKEL